MQQVPLLVVSDAVDQSTGLARIARDLCSIFLSMPEVRVASLGGCGIGSSRLPWPQYHMQDGEYGERTLALAWDDFSQGVPGVVLTIYDLSRVLWLARPEFVADERLRDWLIARRTHVGQGGFNLWGYFPIDSTGPNDRLTGQSRDTLLGYDRVLAYSLWAEGVIRRTIGDAEADKRDCTFLPHGINTQVFHP